MVCLLIAAVTYGIYLLFLSLSHRIGVDISSIPTAVVARTTLTDKVIEQGQLESQSTVNGNCEISNNENKIIFLAVEGSVVKKGDVVVKFDTAEVTEKISERESQVNEANTLVEAARQELRVQEDENVTLTRKAKQDHEFAELDLKKYIEGDYLVKKSDIEGFISESQTAVDKANRDLENMRALVKRGFREFEQLREAQQVVKSTELRLTNHKQKLDSLERFEHIKSLAEFKGKAEETQHQLEIVKNTAAAKLAKATDNLKNAERGLELQKKRLKKLQENLEKHVMKAPQEGTLAFAHDDWRGDGEKIHEGSLVFENQPVFLLPDMERMQVKVGIHESLVSKVKAKQRAVIRVDAFPGQNLIGTVMSVSPLSASNRWEPSNNYQVMVHIDSFSKDMKLKPGMSAEVEIRVGEYANVLAVPIQAVTSFGNKKFVFVKSPANDFSAQEIGTGKTTTSFVEVTTGLGENDVVALDAYQRGITEFGTDQSGPDPLLEPGPTIDNEVATPTTEIGKTSAESTLPENATDVNAVPKEVQSVEPSTNVESATSEPTTSEPTTSEPTTDSPITSDPTANEPAKVEPTGESPAPVELKTSEPPVDQPSGEAIGSSVRRWLISDPAWRTWCGSGLKESRDV